jgi:signal transduction histidine kinase
MTMEATRDHERDHEVSRYQVIGVPLPELEDLAAVAAALCHVPVVAIRLMRLDTEVTVAAVGVEPSVCPREDSMCNLVLYAGHPIEVSDASKDPRWADNPQVNGQVSSFRFYYAQQLVSPRGIVVGTMCVFDYVPRVLTDEDHVLLRRIAGRVVDLLELHLRTHELEETVHELTAARAELQRSNEMLGTFAGQVAHDLRGPVTAVSASLEMLREQAPELDADQSWLLDRARGSVKRMDQLIGEMLAYASVGGYPERGHVDLDEVIRLLRDDLAADLSGVVLLAHDLPVVHGDATQWRVVLQNLVSNAVKFTRELPEPLIRVCAGVEPGGWWLEVADNGPGVSVADRERVFGVLTQGDSSHGGIGLGLATCLRIVEAHGGTIVLDEAPEGGALVRIDVPLS